MRLQQINIGTASKIPPGKNFPGANDPEAVSRLTGSNPRIVHPKLNTTPVSMSYAQVRSEPKTARARGKGRAFKRRMNSKRGRK